MVKVIHLNEWLRVKCLLFDFKSLQFIRWPQPWDRRGEEKSFVWTDLTPYTYSFSLGTRKIRVRSFRGRKTTDNFLKTFRQSHSVHFKYWTCSHLSTCPTWIDKVEWWQRIVEWGFEWQKLVGKIIWVSRHPIPKSVPSPKDEVLQTPESIFFENPSPTLEDYRVDRPSGSNE